jgi:hypothetical protein
MKLIKNVNVTVLLLPGIIFFSCSLKEIKEPSPGINVIKINEKYRINLPEEHSSGYIWQLDDNFDRSVIQNLSSVWHGKKKGVDFNFSTLAAGQATLTFHLIKYRDTSASQQFIVQIDAK